MTDLSSAVAGTFFFDLVQKGGYLMYPIILCSIIAVAISIERLWSLRRDKVIPPAVLSGVKSSLLKGRLDRAVSICRETPSPMGSIILAAISSAGKGPDKMRKAVEDAGRHEVPQLERHLTWLSTIASVTPLLGLLGTVMGIIKVFNVISSQGPGNPGALAGGISVALLTTAAGLTVAIPSLVLYNYLINKADQLIIEIEKQSMVLMDMLVEKRESAVERENDI